MNARKSEAKEEQNKVDQEIQDLNNRFTISVSDLKTEIEQSIKWDLARRALALVAGTLAIAVITLFAADSLVRKKDRKKAEEAAAVASATSPASYSIDVDGVDSGNGTTEAGGGSGSNSSGGLLRRRKTGTSGSTSSGGNGNVGALNTSTVRLRPAEELGLVEQYEPDQEGRFV